MPWTCEHCGAVRVSRTVYTNASQDEYFAEDDQELSDPIDCGSLESNDVVDVSNEILCSRCGGDAEWVEEPEDNEEESVEVEIVPEPEPVMNATKDEPLEGVRNAYASHNSR